MTPKLTDIIVKGIDATIMAFCCWANCSCVWPGGICPPFAGKLRTAPTNMMKPEKRPAQPIFFAVFIGTGME